MKFVVFMSLFIIGCSSVKKEEVAVESTQPDYIERGIAVEYSDGATTLKGYVSRPMTKDLLNCPT